MNYRGTCRLLAFVLGLAACGEGPAGPDDDVLVGQFGDADTPVELLATHAGVTLDLGCGAFFISEEPARLDADRGFSVEGSYRPGGFVVGGDLDATVSGRVERVSMVDVVTATLLIEGGGPVIDPLVVSLRRGQDYEGEPLPCPA
jgi:hypothetical protein